ncbi:MAG TPA: hypothetical protein VGN68_12975 [Sphingopyxis sp.]|jgi:hypothetical protein|uniref:hypothetical protein n=1 Tax=Sphingopyxis sp. TaxID=1908224 RepID=UPI002E160E8C|nr:hypothetical protein [Sphingopyxis sp.]
MAAGKSIFGKAVGFAAGLLGAGGAQAAVLPAKAPDVTSPTAPTDAEVEAELRSLRLVVRDAGYAAHRNRILAERGAQPDDVIFTTPFAKGLELILVADEPTTSEPWMLRELDLYKVTQDEIMALGRRQVLAILPSLPPAEAVVGGVVMVPKMDYLASLMLADGWDELDAALGGNLLVAVPSDDVLIVADARAADIGAKLPAFVKAQYDDANRSVSPLVYRRQGGAWMAIE